MNNKIRDSLFFIIVFSLIFNRIPEPIQMRFIGGPVGSKLVFYPLLIGMLYTCYCHYKYKNVFVNLNKIFKFLSIYLGIIFVSLLAGLYNYPYWNLITNGPVEQIEKLPKVIAFLNEHCGIESDVKVLTSFWLVARTIKGLFLETFYIFGGAYIIYCWYLDDWKQGFRIFCLGVLASLVIICSYSLVEVFYLSGSKLAKNILIDITPYIHTIKENNTWWPPLLWKNQLRSVFAEPSHFSIYSAFCMPILWFFIFRSKLKNKIAWVLVLITTIMTFFIVLAKARTGFLLHVGELLVLFLCLLYVRNKELLKKSVVILCCSSVAFLCGNLYITNYMSVQKSVSVQKSALIKKSLMNYVDDNAISLVDPNRRSNRARYSVMEADFKIGLDNPVLGVGLGLRSAYLPDYLSEKALKNREVKMWLKHRAKYGHLARSMPKLGEYTSRFSETGILGVFIFLLPAVYLILKILRSFYTIEECIFLTAFIGILASGIGDVLNVTYCYSVLLGLGYAMYCGRNRLGNSEEDYK